MNRIITLFVVVFSSLVLFSSCSSNSNEEGTSGENSPVVTSTVERVRCATDRSGYFALYFKLENGLVGEVQYFHHENLELNLIEVGDEISYRMSDDYTHFEDSNGNDYEVVKVSLKKQDKDNSDSYWN